MCNIERNKTEQELFWQGQFGDEYINRNRNNSLIASNVCLFSEIIRFTRQVKNILEFGANIGNNLHALRKLLPEAYFSGIEINKKAFQELQYHFGEGAIYGSILDFKPSKLYDFVLIKGVLIHINPDMLKTVYKKLYESSKKYICIVDYYNPVPVEVEYREHKGYLFKRDWAGEILDEYPDLKLINYGFSYHRDNNFKFGDSTWFLLSK